MKLLVAQEKGTTKIHVGFVVRDDILHSVVEYDQKEPDCFTAESHFPCEICELHGLDLQKFDKIAKTMFEEVSWN